MEKLFSRENLQILLGLSLTALLVLFGIQSVERQRAAEAASRSVVCEQGDSKDLRPNLSGDLDLKVFQSEDVSVRVVELELHPVDPSPGEEQTLAVVIDAPLSDIASVSVSVKSEDGISIVPLSFAREVAFEENRKYRVEGDQLVVRDDFSIALEKVMNRIYGTAKAERTGLRFEATRVSEEVFERVQEISFEIRDSLGNLVPVALATASDHCNIPVRGAWTMIGNCTPPSFPHGVIDGQATLSSGTLTVTGDFYVARSSAGATKISLSGGSISLSGSGTIQVKDSICGNLYVDDSDTDNYVPGPGTNYTSTDTGRVDRCNVTNGRLFDEDCNDGNSNIYPGSNWTCVTGSYGGYGTCKYGVTYNSSCGWSGTPTCNPTGTKCRYRTRYKCAGDGDGDCNWVYYYENDVVGCSPVLC